MPDKAGKYAKDDGGDADGRDQMKLRTEAGRKCVKSIQHYKVLTPEWLALVDSLHQLARLAQLDGLMPNDAKVQDALGRNTDEPGTLWDQEQQENAIRVLVEEAKVNLCLRIMNDYKRWHYDTNERKQSIKEALQNVEYTEQSLETKCIQFEESLGLLLEKAFQHVETLQLMDVQLLIEHCVLVLKHSEALSLPAPTNPKTQETVVLSYFASLATHAEKLNNTELLAKLQEFGLLHYVVNHTLRHCQDYPQEVLLRVCEGLSRLCDNEDFQTIWKDFFTVDPDMEKASFLQLDAMVVQNILSQNPAKRKDLRPLTDFFNTIKRGR